MNKSKVLLKNTLLFSIGSIGSKFLQFLLLPFYTNVLSKEQYGTIDLIQNIAMLLVPIVSLTIFDAVFRYAMDKTSDNKDVFSVGIYISILGFIFMSLIASPLFLLKIYDQYVWLIVFYSFSNILRTTVSQFTKAIGETKLFTIDNMLQTALILLLNIIFLSVFHLGINGYIIGYIMGNFISAFFVFIYLKLWKYLKYKNINKAILKSMLIFSIPLIPNTICWWISTFADRFMVTNLISAEANGIYAISYKVPSILVIVVGVFLQAWQISANEEFADAGRDKFYTDIFNYLQAFTFVVSSILILSAKMITSIMVSKEFYVSWEYMPCLLLGITFFTFGQFLGSVYTANKKTFMAFITNLIVAIVNIILNLFFIRWWGILGAAIATAISYVVFWISRLIDVKRIVKIKYNYLSLAIQGILLCVEAIIMTFEIHNYQIYCFICLSIIILVNKKIINKILNKLKKRLVK